MKKEQTVKRRNSNKKNTYTNIRIEVVAFRNIRVTGWLRIQMVAPCSHNKIVHYATRLQRFTKRLESATNSSRHNSIFTALILKKNHIITMIQEKNK
jgi:hypothetical protein